MCAVVCFNPNHHSVFNQKLCCNKLIENAKIRNCDWLFIQLNTIFSGKSNQIKCRLEKEIKNLFHLCFHCDYLALVSFFLFPTKTMDIEKSTSALPERSTEWYLYYICKEEGRTIDSSMPHSFLCFSFHLSLFHFSLSHISLSSIHHRLLRLFDLYLMGMKKCERKWWWLDRFICSCCCCCTVKSWS